VTDTIRAVRILIARDQRSDDIHCRMDEDRRREWFAARSAIRRWRRRLFKLDGFRRISDQMSAPNLLDLVVELPILEMIRAHNWDMSTAREKQIRARSDVGTTARVLRNYARMEVPEIQQQLLSIANDIERNASAADNDLANEMFDFQSVGTRGGAQNLAGSQRAFVIRKLGAAIPEGVTERWAAIAELVRFIGFDDTTPQLVRSTLT
jgi:hypothetical protein